MASSSTFKYQEENPIFIHNLWSLRLECLEHMNSKLRRLQDRMPKVSPLDREQKLDEATELLTRFGAYRVSTWVDTEMT